LFYLKAQILAEQGKKQNNQSILREASISDRQKEQLPAELVKQIEREKSRSSSQQSWN